MGGPELSELTSWSVLPFQCPPCVHGARESNVSEQKMCSMGWALAGSERGLEVYWQLPGSGQGVFVHFHTPSLPVSPSWA